MESKAAIQTIGNQIPKANLENGAESNRQVHPARTSDQPGAAVENRQLTADFFIPFLRFAAQVNFMQQKDGLVQKLFRNSLAETEQQHQCNERTVANQTNYRKKGKVADIFLEKRQSQHHHNQRIQHHNHLIHHRFHGNNGTGRTGIHAQPVHGINLHGLAAGRKWRQCAVQHTHHSHTERIAKFPLWIDHPADQVQGKSLQQPGYTGESKPHQKPGPAQSIRQVPDGINSVGKKEKCNQNNRGNGDGDNTEKILSQRLTKSGSHKLTKLLFQSGTCLLQLFIRNSTALRPRQNRRRALPLFYNKFPKVTTRICKFFRFLFRLFSIPFIEKICNKICRKISKILLQNL